MGSKTCQHREKRISFTHAKLILKQNRDEITYKGYVKHVWRILGGPLSDGGCLSQADTIITHVFKNRLKLQDNALVLSIRR